MEQLIGMGLDIGLGLIALRLVFSLERNQKAMAALLSELTTRVEKLERPEIGFLSGDPGN